MESVTSSGLVAERLLQVIDEGQRTATYKLALILALIDACAERVDAEGRAPATLTTREVAEHVVRIYYPQVREYVGLSGDAQPLRQISNKKSVSLAAIYLLRMAAGDRPLGVAEREQPLEYAKCIDDVEANFARYPLLLLQVLGGASVPFLYSVNWSERVTRGQLNREPGVLTFVAGAADELLRLAPLIRPLVEVHWVREVSKWSHLNVEEIHLRRHLFGADRTSFPDWLRDLLRDTQHDRCFYCEGPLGSRPTQVDHVLPWSRWPNDAIENLVLADGPCNGDKSDRLVVVRHVDRWLERVGASGPDLAEVAAAHGWESSVDRSVALMRAGYSHIPLGSPLWAGRGDVRVEPLDPIRRLLASQT